jgi:N-acetylmuramoyl-L-alanine amidase
MQTANRLNVVLDPGHGGETASGKSQPLGAVGPTGLVEKDVTFGVARAAAAALEGPSVALTRGADDNPSLADRIRAARERDAKAFVSIHVDGGTPGEGRFQVWLHEGAGTSSGRLAAALLQELAALGPTVELPARGALAVLTPSLHSDQTAACLVDLGDFASEAGSRLGDPARQAEIGRVLARAISSYLSNETAIPPAVASQLGHGEAPVSGALAMVTITHVGPYRLAYDRHTTLGVLGADRDTRNFQGTQALQDALNRWAPYIPRLMNAPRYVMTGGLHVSKPGEHGAGNAIDVDGFWWSDTDKFQAINAPRDWYTYLTIEASLRKCFGTVLNYDYNAAHHDHWHCDLGYPTTWRRAASQVLFVKRALKEIWRESSLTVSRTWDAAAAQAATRAGYDLATSGAWDRFLDDMAARQSTARAAELVA